MGDAYSLFKPDPSRCTSTGRKCDGYAQDKVERPDARGLNQASLPRSTIPMFSTGDNVHYLEFYHHCAGRTLSSKFDDGFWSRIVLQMAQSESTVRHALIALSYLYKSESGSMKHARWSLVAGSQRKTLFFHYNKAIKCLIDRMDEPSYTPEVGLVTCLLFICIEFLRANYHAAFTHLSSGLKIISEWQKGRMGGLSSSTKSPSLHLSPATLRHFSGPASMIEDSLVPMFMRTITPALLFGVSIDQIVNIPIPRPQRCLEQPFATIHEAQSSNLELRNASILVFTNIARKLILREPITTADFGTQAQLLEGHHSWFRALQTLERSKCLSKEDRIVASMLKVGYYSTYIQLACTGDFRQTPYDAHLASFQALNHHAKLVLDSMDLPPSSPSALQADQPRPLRPATSHAPPAPSSNTRPGPAANFTFEVSLIPSLHFSALRCRCPLTRREAISLLALNPPREALWDAEQHVAVAKREIEIEESEIDPATGWPAESSRLWCAVIDGNMDRNGGFWVTFAYAVWAQNPEARAGGERRRADAQWEEWFVL